MMGSIRQQGVTTASHVFDVLRQDLLNGTFGAGERLSIAGLRARYQVGLSPLREALNRLAALGLLHQEYQRGFRVLELTHAELSDITELRWQLEGMALESAIMHGDTEWESQLLAASHRLGSVDDAVDEEEWERLHARFHYALVAACGSTWLLRFIAQLHDQFDRYRRLAPGQHELRKRLDYQHEALVGLALSRDVDGARALISEHIMLSSQVARESCRG